MMHFLDGKNILVTGGTGSFGKKFIRSVLNGASPRRLIILSRDEMKQFEMRKLFPEDRNGPIRYFIGDIRDRERLYRAFNEVDVVVHAAALKQVPACEYNPIEAINTNVIGAKNIIDAAIDQGVARVLALSTDKAVNPVNVYGASKLCSEKLFIQANAYTGGQAASGKITITDSRMTRFWITLRQGVEFVANCIEQMHGGEIFVPKIPSMNVMDLADAIATGCEIEYIGVRPGEKLHESMLSVDEARHSVELDRMFVIKPLHPWFSADFWPEGKALPDGYSYTSDNNTEWLSVDDLKQLLTPGQGPEDEAVPDTPVTEKPSAAKTKDGDVAQKVASAQ
jgi:UDP-N-acetylglucosamine 4,6-dehydratase